MKPFCLHTHTPESRHYDRSKGTFFDLNYALVIGSFLLFLVLSINLCDIFFFVQGVAKKTTPFENLQLKLTEKQSDPHFLTIISLCYEGKKNTKFVCKS